MPEASPLARIKNVMEVAKVVGEYQVTIGAMTITVKVLYYYHLPPGMQYMALPSHSLIIDGEPYHPLRNYGSEEEALEDLVLEFGIRVEQEWGAEHWMPFDRAS